MSIKVWDFLCPDGHVSERFVDVDCVTVICLVDLCGKHAIRQLAAPRARLNGISGHFPSAADAWERNRASHLAKEKANIRENGEYLNGTNAVYDE